MKNSFDLKTSLVCEGIIGDGCGGGRLFYIRDEKLIAYDPNTKIEIILLQNICKPISISKSACLIYVECEKEDIKFDLSALKKI